MVRKPMLPNAVTVEEAKQEVVSRVEKDHDEIMEVVEKVAGFQEGLESLEALAMDSVAGNVVSFPTIASSAISSMSQIAKANVVTPVILKAELSVIGNESVMLLGKEVKGVYKEVLSPVEMEAKNDLDTSASKAFKVDEASDSGLGMQTSLCVEMDSHVCSPHKGPIIKSILYKYGDKPSPLSSLCVEVDKHVLSPHNGPIIKSILYKYGDITMGSTFRSMDAKLAFLELMADAVYQLSNLTLDTVSSHEIELIEAKVADVLAAGFNVKWLKQRVDEVIASIKCQEYCMELEELDKRIEATKKSLVDMEQQRVVLAREVIAIKAQNERNGILGRTLAEGLL
nr:hypothetical protein CFP56_35023 [Quercus suber]